jgi:formate hydrogenlyase transcriptional activator
MAEGLRSGCDLPLVGRNGVVGMLAASSRSESAFCDDDVLFLEQAGRQVAIAVENALSYQKAMEDRDKETKRRNRGSIWRRKFVPSLGPSSGTAQL